MFKRPVRLLSLTLALILALSAFSVLAADLSLIIRDRLDRECVFPTTPKRLIALMPADCEILAAIGAESMLVGRGKDCDYPKSLETIPALGYGQELNLEQILALKPDCVFLSTMGHTKEQVEALEKAGVKVVVTDALSLAQVDENIKMMGLLTGHTDKAFEVADQLKRGFEDLKKECENKPELKAYYEVSPLKWGLWAAGGGSFLNEIGEMLKLKNIFGDQPAWAQVSPEQVLALNPECIVTTDMYLGEGVKPEEEIMAREGWAKVSAVENHKVFNADASAMTRPGPRLLQAAIALRDFLYGAK